MDDSSVVMDKLIDWAHFNQIPTPDRSVDWAWEHVRISVIHATFDVIISGFVSGVSATDFRDYKNNW